jgi:hypothetical protein
MKQIFLIISCVLPLISPIIYSRAILKGEAKPHRTTRFVLLLISCLATLSLFAQHDHVAIWLAGASAVQAIVIFILSIKYGMGGWAKMDILCLVIALIGIIAWQTTHQPVIALYFAIFADFTGMIPALLKTYRLPETEIWLFYLLDTIAAGFNLLALQHWTPQEFSYPIYIVVINLVMVGLITRPFAKLTIAR